MTSARTAACCERALELRGEWRRARHRQLAILAILLFCYSAARRCLRCQPLRLVAGAVTWCAYHATSTHVQHTPHHNVRGEGPGTGRRCLGFAAARIHWALHAAFAAVDVRAATYVPSAASATQATWREAKGSGIGCCPPRTRCALRSAMPWRQAGRCGPAWAAGVDGPRTFDMVVWACW